MTDERARSIDYPGLMRDALATVVASALRMAVDGLPGGHHFYLSFHTDAEGVVLPETLRRRYPHQLTVVLQCRYWNLLVTDSGFGVTLEFGGAPLRLEVPFSALISFVDPSVPFGFNLSCAVVADVEPAKPEPPALGKITGRVVVDFDAFRQARQKRGVGGGNSAA